jgi:hypothetical protein
MHRRDSLHALSTLCLPMRVRRRSASLALALLAGAGGGISTAYAQNLGFLHDSPISFMKQKDMASLTTALNEALDKNTDGQTSDWNNQGLGNSVPITATITPKDALKEQGTDCRHVAVQLNARNQQQNWQPLYCKSPQGWKIQKR